ncbi:MAG: hypothetical protein EOP83_05125 [Verrucomicrobiaceae bacterium]|nr:MAG: hypothetical protein EOP83_05125 [Verrucomicrobiaceae bacterium]
MTEHLCTTHCFDIREMSDDELESFRGTEVMVRLLRNQVAIGGTHVTLGKADLAAKIVHEIRSWLRDNSTETFHIRSNDKHFFIIKLYSEADKMALRQWWHRRQDTYTV